MKQDVVLSSKQLCDGRFVLRRRLGEGGFGVVYAAFDRARGCEVALKVLTGVEGQALYRFKQEFRSLADVRHPNLIGLQELFADDDMWFFTMELISGVRFVDWVRNCDSAPQQKESTAIIHEAETMKVLMNFDDEDALPVIEAEPALDEGRLDVGRLRAALPQLVEGLSALHEVGKLHCDLKPSNVMVTPEGRVVVLDFGLVREADTGSDATEQEGTTAGTPAYMSPEHGRGERLSEASDWYSIGVMLFESLTGQLPFAGSASLILTAKNQVEAPRPSEITPGLPRDLEALCCDLLLLNDALRPKRKEIRERAHARASDQIDGRTLVGRARELRLLQASYTRVKAGASERVLVHGASGSGKSTLVRYFLEDVRDACLLSSRCYEQESVPYKGVDGIVDSLTRRLLGVSSREQDRILGQEGAALVPLFPVLRTVPALTNSDQSCVSSREQRARAIAALQMILSRLSEDMPVVLVIDDLQWMDRDSAAIIDSLFINAPPRLLLIGTARESTELDGADAIALSALDEDACRQLARALVGDDPRAERIARESRGDPLLVETLCRDLREHGDLLGETSLEAAVIRRIGRLSPAVRRLFELVACAGRPIESALLGRAAGEATTDVSLAELSSRRLLKVRSAQAATFVEAAHDRVRDVVLSRLPSYARRVHHAALAQALEETHGVSDELLAVHWQAAGHDANAAERLMRAAAAAERVSAFDRAARLYGQAIELSSQRKTSRLYAQLGGVLEKIGNLQDAGAAFLSAAELMSGEEAATLKSRGNALRNGPAPLTSR